MRAHDIFCSSFQFSGTVKIVGSDRKCGCSDTSDIVDTFTPTFINPILFIFTYSEIRKLGSQKILHLFDTHQQSNTKT